MNIDIMAEKSV